MRSSTRPISTSFATLVTLLTLASGAAAQEVPAPPDGTATGYPLSNAQRPLTLPAGLLHIDAGLGFSKICPGFGGTGRCARTLVAMSVGASYGITDDLEIGALVLPLLFSPDFDYGDPSLYAQYRFVTGDVEVGVRADITFPVLGRFLAEVGVPVWFKLSPTVALRTGGFLTFADVGEAGVGLSLPFAAVFNATESLWLGVDTGMSFLFNSGGPGDTFVMPLTLQVGYAIPGGSGAPLLDVVGSFGFPLFFYPASNDVIFTRLWSLGFGARIYIDTQG